MRTSVVIRIIIWAVVALLLVSILVSGIASSASIFGWRPNFFGAFDFIGGSIGNIGSGFSYDNSESYIAGGTQIPAENITAIDINWIDGNVNVIEGTSSEIKFSESSNMQMEDEYKLHYYINDGKLTIQYCRSRVAFPMVDTLEKELTLELPEGLMLASLRVDAVSSGITVEHVYADTTRIECVSGGISLNDIQGNELRMETVSGSLHAQDLAVSELYTESVSGSIEISALDVKDVDCETLSGAIRVDLGAGLQSFDAESISGSIRITLPENDGFTARYSSASGSFQCGFPVEREKKPAIYKNGEIDLTLSTVSGSMYIEKQ